MKNNALHIVRMAIAVVALLLAAANVHAQELTITNATQAMEPMTVPMQRLDFNEQICALVKVELPVAGVQFEGNIVGEPLFKTTEYWVYLTPGTKMMKIKAPGYYSVMADFRELGLGALESKAIYYLTLKATGSGPVKPTIETNFAVFSVDPPTATVKIDGQSQPVEDGSVVVLLKLGQHTWQAEAVGYASDNGSFQVTATDKANVNIKLRSQKAQLKINTLAQAAVIVNGQQRGTGSRTLELLPGVYNIELNVAGHKPYTQTLELQASQTEQINCTEFTPVYGSLIVNYRPVGASISLNGRQAGTTPASLNEVIVGDYTLAVSAPGYTTHTQQIRITETTPVNLNGALQKLATANPATTNVTSASSKYSTTPKNLALCAELNGRIVYITLKQWQAMPAIEKAACKKRGLCVIGNGERFLLALNDSGEKEMTWGEAMSRYGNSLPTKEQAEVMGKNCEAINAAIIAFGGDKDPSWYYWTRTERNSSYAWSVHMNYGTVFNFGKANTLRVRAVAPVPVSSAM